MRNELSRTLNAHVLLRDTYAPQIIWIIEEEIGARCILSNWPLSSRYLWRQLCYSSASPRALHARAGSNCIDDTTCYNGSNFTVFHIDQSRDIGAATVTGTGISSHRAR